MDLFPATQEAISCLYGNHDQKSMAGEVIGPRVETAIVVLLRGHLVKFPINYYNNGSYRPWPFSALFREASF